MPGVPLRLAFVSVVLLVFAVPAMAADGSACAGRDLRAVLAETDPVADGQLRAHVAAMPFAKGTFFRVTKPGIAPNYVLGTIHVLDREGAQLPDAVTDALGHAVVVALELKETGSMSDPKALLPLLPTILPLAVAKPSQSLEALLPADAKPQVEQALKQRGLPPVFARTFKPSFVSAMLSLPPCLLAGGALPEGVDARVAAVARARSVPVVGLESLEEQFQALLRQPAEVEVSLAKTLPQSLAVLDDFFFTIQAAYADGDIGWILASSEQQMGAQAPQAMPESYRQSLVLRRNHVMHDRSLAWVSAGGALIAVGAAHLPGEEGLLRLFEQDGFTIERLH